MTPTQQKDMKTNATLVENIKVRWSLFDLSLGVDVVFVTGKPSKSKHSNTGRAGGEADWNGLAVYLSSRTGFMLLVITKTSRECNRNRTPIAS